MVGGAAVEYQDALEALATLATNGVSTGDVCLYVQSLIDFLSNDNDFEKKVSTLVEKNLFPNLALVMYKSAENIQVIKVATRCLQMALSCESSLLKAVEGGVSELTISAMKNHSSDIPIVCRCIVILGKLAANPRVQELIRHQGGIEATVSAISTHIASEKVLDCGFYCLGNLARDNEENVERMMEAGCIKSLGVVVAAFTGVGINVFEGALQCLAHIAHTTEKHARRVYGEKVLESICKGATDDLDSLQSSTMTRILELITVLLSYRTILRDALVNMALYQFAKIGSFAKKDRELASIFSSVVCNISSDIDQDDVMRLFDAEMLTTLRETGTSHRNDVEIQTMLTGSYLNLIRKQNGFEKEIFELLQNDGIVVAIEALQSLAEAKTVVALAIPLLSTLATDVNVLLKTDLTVVVITLVKVANLYINNPSILMMVFQAFTIVSKRARSRELVIESGLMEFCIQVAVKWQRKSSVLEALLQLLSNLALIESASIDLGESTVPIVINLVKGNQRNVQVTAAAMTYFCNLGAQHQLVDTLEKFGTIECLVEILKLQRAEIVVACSTMEAIRKIMSVNQEAKVTVQRLDTVRIVDDIKFRHAGNVKVAEAAQSFVKTLNSLDLVTSKKSARVTDSSLVSNINIPELDATIRYFLVAGAVLRKHSKRVPPRKRHVFISKDLRFLVWRDPNDTNDPPRSMYVQNLTEIISGAHSPELQRSIKGHSKASDSNCFTIVGANRTLNLECENNEKRDLWVNSLRALIKYHDELKLIR